MKQFTHCVMDSIGIHARPAGLLARAVKAFDSTVVITKADGRSANASKLMAVMSLGIKTGGTLTVTVEGGDEESNTALMEKFCKENL